LRTSWAVQWRELGIHALLCPAHASVASAHDECHYWYVLDLNQRFAAINNRNRGYTSVFNSLDLSAAVLPVGTVRESDTWDVYPTDVPIMGSIDAEYRQQYHPAKYAEAPISLQVVTSRLQEEKLLEVMSVVDNSVNGRVQFLQTQDAPVKNSSTDDWSYRNALEAIISTA
jgi:amidase